MLLPIGPEAQDHRRRARVEPVLDHGRRVRAGEHLEQRRLDDEWHALAAVLARNRQANQTHFRQPTQVLGHRRRNLDITHMSRAQAIDFGSSLRNLAADVRAGHGEYFSPARCRLGWPGSIRRLGKQRHQPLPIDDPVVIEGQVRVRAEGVLRRRDQVVVDLEVVDVVARDISNRVATRGERERLESPVIVVIRAERLADVEPVERIPV